jgi:trigger factor
MQISLEKPSVLERRMKVEVPEERISTAVESRLVKLVQTARIDGFRKGKTPLSIVRQRYAASVRDEVVGETLKTTFSEALASESLQPAGQPVIEEVAAEVGAGLTYMAAFEVFPVIEPASLEKVDVAKLNCEICDEDIEKVIGQLRDHHKIWTEVDRPAKNGDQLSIDFSGSIDGEPFDGGTGSDFEVSLGSRTMIEGFEDGLLEQSKGDTAVLALKFPEGYQNEALAGKPVQFDIEVKKVSESSIPDMDDAFFEKFGVKEGGEEAFRAQVLENMEKERDKTQVTRFRNEIMEKVMDANQFEIPKSLVADEVGRQRELMSRELAMRGANPSSDAEAFEKALADRAEGSVKMGLLMAEIIKREDLKAEPDKVKDMISKMAAGYEDSEAITKWYYENPEQLKQVESACLEETVVDWLAQQARVKEESISFDGLMNPMQTSN